MSNFKNAKIHSDDADFIGQKVSTFTDCAVVQDAVNPNEQLVELIRKLSEVAEYRQTLDARLDVRDYFRRLIRRVLDADRRNDERRAFSRRFSDERMRERCIAQAIKIHPRRDFETAPVLDA